MPATDAIAKKRMTFFVILSPGIMTFDVHMYRVAQKSKPLSTIIIKSY